MADNYAIMLERARELFRACDLDGGCRRLGLPCGERGAELELLGRRCLVERNTARVCYADGSLAPPLTALILYDALSRTGDPPCLSGEFVPTQSLHGIMGSNSVHEGLNAREAAFFSGRGEALRRACLALGGTAGGTGDVCVTLPVFAGFPVQLRFWEADAEFPAQLQFFWDRNAKDFLRYETLWYVSGTLTGQLRAALAGEAGQV